MSDDQILAELLEQGLMLWADDEGLCYRAPQGGLTPEMRATLVAHKPALLARLGRHEKYVRASFGQQRIWFFEQLSPGSATYNIPLYLELRGLLDVAAAQAALAGLAHRHESLRTRVVGLAGLLVQVVGPAAGPPLPVVDLSAAPAADQEAHRQALAEASLPFDLATGPLWRATLFRLAPDAHRLLIVFHHIICDEISLEIFQREWTALYEAAVRGTTTALPTLPFQYGEYAVWQHDWLQGAALAAQLDYWTARFADLPPALELPLDRPRPAQPSYRGAVATLDLPASTAAGLRDLSRQTHATLFMTTLAACQALLYRYSGQSDLVVGLPVGMRNAAELQGVIGFFVNTLALRTDLSGNPSFRDLLARVRQAVLDGYTHQDLPFEKLVEAVHPQQDRGRTPLFNVMFDLYHAPESPGLPGGLTLTPCDLDPATAKFDLSINLEESPAGLRVLVEYPTDLFEPATIARLLGHYATLLAAVVADPDTRLADMPLLTPAERVTILETWNPPPMADRPPTAHALIAEQAHATPDAVAVIDQDRRLTYRELDAQANQLAHYLQARRVGPEVGVAVCLDRTNELIVVLLGIWKAGGAYIPLNPANPPERLAYLLADARPALLVTQPDVAATLAPGPTPVLTLDMIWPALAPLPATPPATTSRGEHLAYLIYTSGSTGQPKGTLVTHAALVNSYCGWEREYRLRAATRRHLQMAQASFDVFSGDLVRALCSGGALVLCPQELLGAPDALYTLMCREQVDCAEFVPAVVRELAQYLRTTGQALAFMRVLVVGSDNWYVQEHRDLATLGGPQTRLINSYGLTEAAIDSSYYEGDTSAFAPDSMVPIGRPFPNTQIYLLDPAGRPVPVGVPGELYIGGAGLARGYLVRPDLTAARFVPHPFSTQPGARLYRTGDRARWRADGTVEFLGRADHQVKIRGQRIELGEIEAALAAHPAVRAALVLAAETAPGDKQLVAYIRLTNPGSPDSALSTTLRDFLRTQLPPYMIPAAWVLLEQFPLTAHGKVDRRVLLRLAPTRTEHTAEQFVAPRTPSETALAAIWTEVLRCPRIGLHDDFFALGGHSLLAMRVITRIREQFQVDVPLRVLFDQPTVAGLATVIAQAPAPAQGSAGPIARVARADYRMTRSSLQAEAPRWRPA